MHVDIEANLLDQAFDAPIPRAEMMIIIVNGYQKILKHAHFDLSHASFRVSARVYKIVANLELR